MDVADDGTVTESDVYRAVVLNRAKLAYHGVAAWLDGTAPPPPRLATVPGLDQQLRIQDRVAQSMKGLRHHHGALSLDTLEARAVFDGEVLSDLRPDEKNRAKELIEDFMIASNGVTAKYLERKGFRRCGGFCARPCAGNGSSSSRPASGGRLPPQPSAHAREDFLARRRQADPLGFPDLSLSVVKLLGSGEYVTELPGQAVDRHFGLAARLHPFHRSQPCTEQEDNAAKVERQVRKSAAALLLAPRIGRRFDAIVTGASAKGTWVRTLQPSADGRVVRGFQDLDVGDRVRVELVRTDVERGFVDFARVSG